MAAIGVQQAPSSCRALQQAFQRPGTSEHRAAACNAPAPLCCKKQGVILSRSSQSGKAILLAKGTRGRLSALQSIAAWEGKQHLGAASFDDLYGMPKGSVSRRATRGLVTASLLGVGAPEALVIGVVALLVFGPKGLAEVARNVGKTLKTFQPTIKELQDVSREFRSTLEQEIGLDELRDPYRTPTTPPPQQKLPPSADKPPTEETAAKPDPTKEEDRPSPRAYTTDEMLRVTEEQAKQLVSEEKRKAAEAAAWGGQPPSGKAEEKAPEKLPEVAKVGGGSGKGEEAAAEKAPEVAKVEGGSAKAEEGAVKLPEVAKVGGGKEESL